MIMVSFKCISHANENVNAVVGGSDSGHSIILVKDEDPSSDGIFPEPSESRSSSPDSYLVPYRLDEQLTSFAEHSHQLGAQRAVFLATEKSALGEIIKTGKQLLVRHEPWPTMSWISYNDHVFEEAQSLIP